DRFVRNPAEVVKVHQKVRATVLEVDLPRKRIALSLKTNPELPGAGGAPRRDQPADRGPRPGGGQKPGSPKPVDWFTAAMEKARKK
ncbi:MAG TPA: S1 RNA-binding domain-containing protein, partial [Candidatus Sulfotelmatobacter sp.]|nr:S1 RNA-binding domain-containing protein [Candidatus Sulfotelmatobacter sp.]